MPRAKQMPKAADASAPVRVKIFTAFGGSDIKALEHQFNRWSAENMPEIYSVTPAMCPIGHSGEIYQHAMLTVLYRGGK